MVKKMRDIASALRSRCVHAFEEDPDTEVGKVQAVKGQPDAWGFYVYVMNGDECVGSRSCKHSNVVLVSPERIEVVGPDERSIAQVLKEPLL